MSSIFSSTDISVQPNQLSLEKRDDSSHYLGDVLIEVIVVDGGSKRDSPIGLKTIFPKVGFKFLNENIGFSRCCNIGSSYASGKYLLFLNPDTVIRQNCISTLFKAVNHENSGQIGILSTLMENQSGELCPIPLKYPTIYQLFGLIPLFEQMSIFKKMKKKKRKHYKIYPDLSVDLIETDWVLGAVMLIKKNLFESLKGFDETFLLFSEDIDLCHRVKNKGLKILISTKARVSHIGGGATVGVTYLRETVLWQTTFKYFKKHRGNFYSFTARLVVLTCYIFEYLIQVCKFLLSERRDITKQRKRTCLMAIKACVGYTYSLPD